MCSYLSCSDSCGHTLCLFISHQLAQIPLFVCLLNFDQIAIGGMKGLSVHMHTQASIPCALTKSSLLVITDDEDLDKDEDKHDLWWWWWRWWWWWWCRYNLSSKR